MISRVGVELAERFSTQHDSEELARVIERARLVESVEIWQEIAEGSSYWQPLARAAREALARLDEIEGSS